MAKKKLIAMVAITCFVAVTVKADYNVQMFSDDFETSTVVDGTSANWEKFPASATTCSLYSYEDIGLGGTGDAAVQFANGGGLQTGSIKTKPAVWKAVSNVKKITLSYDYKYLNNGDKVYMALGDAYNRVNGYMVCVTPTGLGSGSLTIDKVVDWPAIQNSTTDPNRVNLATNEFSSTAYFNQTGEWNRVVFEMEVEPTQTILTMAWSSLQQPHGNTIIATYTDTSAERLTNVSGLGMFVRRAGAELSPLVDNVSVTALVAGELLFSDDFETWPVVDGTSANWEKFPASATTCSLYSYENTGLGGTGDAALQFANGGGLQIGCMRSKSSAWTAAPFTPTKVTLSYDYKYLNFDVARMALSNSSDLSNSYGIYMYANGLGSGQMVLERISSWPNAQNSVSGFASTTLATNNFSSTAYFNQTGEWNRVVVDLDILADRTDITMTWSSLQQTHGNTLVLNYSDTSANRLTNVSTLGFLGYRAGANLSPFVDNVRVEAVPLTCNFDLLGDIDGPAGVPDCKVDFYDFALLASEWLECANPEGCN